MKKWLVPRLNLHLHIKLRAQSNKLGSLGFSQGFLGNWSRGRRGGLRGKCVPWKSKLKHLEKLTGPLTPQCSWKCVEQSGSHVWALQRLLSSHMVPQQEVAYLLRIHQTVLYSFTLMRLHSESLSPLEVKISVCFHDSPVFLLYVSIRPSYSLRVSSKAFFMVFEIHFPLND